MEGSAVILAVTGTILILGGPIAGYFVFRYRYGHRIRLADQRERRLRSRELKLSQARRSTVGSSPFSGAASESEDTLNMLKEEVEQKSLELSIVRQDYELELRVLAEENYKLRTEIARLRGEPVEVQEVVREERPVTQRASAAPSEQEHNLDTPPIGASTDPEDERPREEPKLESEAVEYWVLSNESEEHEARDPDTRSIEEMSDIFEYLYPEAAESVGADDKAPDERADEAISNVEEADEHGADMPPEHPDAGQPESIGAPDQEERGGDIVPDQEERGGEIVPDQEERGGEIDPDQEERGGEIDPDQEERGGEIAPDQAERGGEIAPDQAERGGEIAPARPDRRPKSFEPKSPEEPAEPIQDTVPLPIFMPVSELIGARAEDSPDFSEIRQIVQLPDEQFRLLSDLGYASLDKIACLTTSEVRRLTEIFQLQGTVIESDWIPNAQLKLFDRGN